MLHRVALFGGVYAENFTTWSLPDIDSALTDDMLSRMINNIWGQTQTYIQFTDLKDGKLARRRPVVS